MAQARTSLALIARMEGVLRQVVAMPGVATADRLAVARAVAEAVALASAQAKLAAAVARRDSDES